MIKLKQILSKGLEQTAALWPPITITYNWVHEAAKILDHQAGLDASLVHIKSGESTIVKLLLMPTSDSELILE